MPNRRARILLYTVPNGSQGRKEATGVITVDGRLIRQNLIVEISDLDLKHDVDPEPGSVLYDIVILDSAPIHDRVRQIAGNFGGTYGSRTSKDYDNGSFFISDFERLKDYLRSLRAPI